jgi:hypothetical protein
VFGRKNGQPEQALLLELVLHEVDLVVEDKLPLQRFGAVCGALWIGSLSLRDIEEVAEHVGHRHEGGCHTATGAQKVPPIHP